MKFMAGVSGLMNITPNFSSIYLSFLALAGGLVMLAAGGDFLVAGAARLARRLGMTPLLIGLTIVAFGTSMPELFVGLAAVMQGYPDILVGNVVGSNIANIGLILGLSALLVPLSVTVKNIAYEFYLVLAATLVLFAVAWMGVFPRIGGLVFVGSLIWYTVYSCRHGINKNDNGEDRSENQASVCSWAKLSALIGLGLVSLALGSGLFIDGAVDVARYFGVSELVIGLTLAAVGTSLPELASSIAAIRRRQYDLVVGNVVGSNLFNLLMVLGSAALFKPFPVSSSMLFRDLPVMLLFSLILLPMLTGRRGMGRHHGVVMLGLYGGYIYLLF
jgi:cation:H+ antiporter